MAKRVKAFELRSTDRDNFFNLYVGGNWKGLVETSKVGRKTNFRVHGAKRNFEDFTGTKKDFEAFAKDRFSS
ncbi:hypothetical protein SEA_YABOI_195 [Streptomyces phage Yaboi]|uniref:Uncharacterized protein n=3 Tax=Streptomyces virus Yaboi TaxID=2846408 RepID=A0A385UJ74_9CAUD|nr:hypothetical protein HWB86_gp126 [Streptomyces phage Yaboi]QAY08817.1 hypothetical protein SEA_GENIE2_191 [Streptomyces phage Genie2]QAY12807.1 hypothetical protein SEA_BOOMERJR_191 [Streptomyces phage BoomerJR]UVD40001.1 hypothetical protein SEA_STANIMAL_191 [Streptomyces phage Stanimal]WNM73743.1 hypothetical protein SEA_SOLLERTIA_192 [Streptomyces phage Sollertia]AYB70993.1 hypothetical protein SEA_YABOI_195 [Streptomyces phage Yaboi]